MRKAEKACYIHEVILIDTQEADEKVVWAHGERYIQKVDLEIS